MHLALIIDDERLEREQPMLNRLCIGLMSEGVQVTRIVPDSAMADTVDDAEKRIALATRITTPMRVLPWMRRSRVNRLAEQLEKTPPDAIYAVGCGAWPIATDLAEVIEQPILVDVCSMQQAMLAPRPRASAWIAGYVAGTEPIARVISSRCGAEMVSVVPVGVALPPQPRSIMTDPDRPVAVAVLGRSGDVRAYEAVMDGLSRLLRGGANLQVFLELRGRHEHDIWRRAEKFDLLRWVSSIGEASSYRALLTWCDLVVLPERLGEIRSIVLEAMAFGIPVLAADDSALEILIHETTALIVPQADASAWERQLRRAVEGQEAARTLGQKARQFVGEHHRSSAQVNRLVQTVERAMSGGAYRLRAGRP